MRSTWVKARSALNVRPGASAGLTAVGVMSLIAAMPISTSTHRAMRPVTRVRRPVGCRFSGDVMSFAPMLALRCRVIATREYCRKNAAEEIMQVAVRRERDAALRVIRVHE